MSHTFYHDLLRCGGGEHCHRIFGGVCPYLWRQRYKPFIGQYFQVLAPSDTFCRNAEVGKVDFVIHHRSWKWPSGCSPDSPLSSRRVVFSSNKLSVSQTSDHRSWLKKWGFPINVGQYFGVQLSQDNREQFPYIDLEISKVSVTAYELRKTKETRWW